LVPFDQNPSRTLTIFNSAGNLTTAKPGGVIQQDLSSWSAGMKSHRTTDQTGRWGFKPRHALIIAIFLAIYFPLIYLLTISSYAYQQAEHFAQTSPEVIKWTGPISKMSLSFWSGFHVTYSGSGGEASFVLSLKGTNEECILDVRMMRLANSWNVVEAYLSTTAQKGIPIIPKAGTSNARRETHLTLSHRVTTSSAPTS
jgi:hypothetical protein